MQFFQSMGNIFVPIMPPLDQELIEELKRTRQAAESIEQDERQLYVNGRTLLPRLLK